jgi:spore germination cell wall hydrolase CwlJ-like protein
MHLFRIAIFIAAIHALGTVVAAEQAQKAEVAEEKAAELEVEASAEGDQAPPAPAETITKSEARAVDPSGDEPLDDAITCLSRSIYWEAKGEGDAGMQAIANVVMNRLGHEGFANTVCAVVKDGQEQGACQFSWWCDGRSDDVVEEEPYARAKELSREALNLQLEDLTQGAMYFHHERLTPDWSEEYIETVKIGEHIFYKPPGGGAK